MDPIEQILELLTQIQELAGVGVEALSAAMGGAPTPEGEPPADGGAPAGGGVPAGGGAPVPDEGAPA